MKKLALTATLIFLTAIPSFANASGGELAAEMILGGLAGYCAGRQDELSGYHTNNLQRFMDNMARENYLREREAHEEYMEMRREMFARELAEEQARKQAAYQEIYKMLYGD
jgi:hypothetical protein